MNSGTGINIAIAVVGWVATALILGAYWLLSIGKIDQSSRLYQWMNIIGASGFVINCTWNHALPSVALNVVWMLIGIYSLVRNRRSKYVSSENS